MVASTVTTGQEPLPIGNWVDPKTGQITPQIRNYLEGRRRKTGEVISGISILEQAITVTETLLTDLDGILSAAYAVTVDVNGRVAGLKLLSDGTTSVASINADTIYFGPQTVFDTATETFITEVGSIRSRYGTAFGASSDLIRWDGPTSVAQNSETPTNGYLAIKTDGTIYHNAAALDWGATAAQSAAENAQVLAGSNSLSDTGFREFTDYWRVLKGSGTSVSFAVSDTASGLRRGSSVGTGITVGSYILLESDGPNNMIPVTENDVVGARALIAGQGISNIQLRITWYTDAGANNGQEILTLSSGIPTGGGEKDTYYEAPLVATAPASTAWATIMVLGVASSSSPRVRMALPTLAVLPPGQTVAPPLSLGMDATRGANVTEDKQAADVAPGAVTNTEAASTDGSIALTAHTWVTVQSRSITATGGDIMVAYNAVPYVTTTTSISPIVQARILRGATTVRPIHTTHFPSTNSDGSQQVGGAYSGFLIDSPSAATYTYYLQLKATTASGSGTLYSSTAEFRSLYLTEFKR